MNNLVTSKMEISPDFLKHKYSFGETVYLIWYNKLREAEIRGIRITERSDFSETGYLHDVEYQLDIIENTILASTNSPYRMKLSDHDWIKEDTIFKTKDEVMISLLEDITNFEDIAV